MGTKDSEEFKNAIRDIAQSAHTLDSPYDRVRCTEWCRKLLELPCDNLDISKLKNEYAQFLRIQVRNNFLHGPFSKPPPDGNLSSLGECLGKMVSRNIPYLPKAGPIAPVVYHKSPDGRAYISLKQVPGGGVLCYMAVSPDMCFK